jgi:hypothetical protein
MYRAKQLQGGKLSLRNDKSAEQAYRAWNALYLVWCIRITQVQAVWFSDRTTQQSLRLNKAQMRLLNI